jgi:hypothetical protein
MSLLMQSLKCTTVSVLSVLFDPEDGGSGFLQKFVFFHQTVWYYIPEDIIL